MILDTEGVVRGKKIFTQPPTIKSISTPFGTLAGIDFNQLVENAVKKDEPATIESDLIFTGNVRLQNLDFTGKFLYIFIYIFFIKSALKTIVYEKWNEEWIRQNNFSKLKEVQPVIRRNPDFNLSRIDQDYKTSNWTY